MNIQRLLLVSFFSLSLSIAFGAADKCQIKGQVKGIKDTVCYLANYYGDKQYVQDTMKVNANGEFVISSAELYPGGIYLVVMPDKRYFEMLLTDNQLFSFATDTSDFIRHMKIKGSKENQFFYEYLVYIQDQHTKMMELQTVLEKVKDKVDSVAIVQQQIKDIDKQVIAYKETYMTANPTLLLSKVFKASKEIDVPEPPKNRDGSIDSLFQYRYYKTHYFDHIDFADDRLLRTPLFHKRLESYFERMIHPSVDSIIKEADYIVEKAKANKEVFKYVVWYLTNTYERSKIMGYDAIFVHMAEKYYMTKQAYWISEKQLETITERAMKLKPLLIDKIAPDILYLTDLNEQYLRLHDIKAKYVMLYFWSPDCGHCKKETPILHEEFNKLKKEGIDVKVFAVSTLRDTAMTKDFIRKHNLYDFINGLDVLKASNFRADYDIFSTPQLYLLDENKKIIAKRLMSDQVVEYILQLEGKASPVIKKEDKLLENR